MHDALPYAPTTRPAKPGLAVGGTRQQLNSPGIPADATRSEVVGGTDIDQQASAIYRVAVSFNVFAERFASGTVRTTINSIMEPLEEVELYNGWVWPGVQKSREPITIPGVLERLRPHVAPTEVSPSPRSVGLFEKAFLNYLVERLVPS